MAHFAAKHRRSWLQYIVLDSVLALTISSNRRLHDRREHFNLSIAIHILLFLALQPIHMAQQSKRLKITLIPLIDIIFVLIVNLWPVVIPLRGHNSACFVSDIGRKML